MPSQIDRLNELIDEQEVTIAAAFREFIRSINSETVAEAIADALEAGNVEAALAIVDSYVVRMATVLPTVQQIMGTAAAAELAQTASQFIVAITFDPTHPRAAQLTRANRLTFVREFSEEQRAATRQAIARGFERGTGTAGIARDFRNSIGLTQYQEGLVNSYEGMLRTLNPKALERAFRDRRFDRGLRNAIEQKRPLTEAKITSMTERYRARQLAARSETIARTEAVRATSTAREEALQQMLEQTKTDPRRVERIWESTKDKRTRDAHRKMDQQRRGLGLPFTDGDGIALRFPGDPQAPARTTINCRCTVSFEIKPPA